MEFRKIDAVRNNNFGFINFLECFEIKIRDSDDSIHFFSKLFEKSVREIKVFHHASHRVQVGVESQDIEAFWPVQYLPAGRHDKIMEVQDIEFFPFQDLADGKGIEIKTEIALRAGDIDWNGCAQKDYVFAVILEYMAPRNDYFRFHA